MIKQRVYRYNVPEDVLMLDILNFTNKRRYTQNKVKFSDPRSLGYLETEIDVAPTDNVNWVGSVPLKYERHDLRTTFLENPIVVDCDNYDTDTVLEAILKQHRVLFEARAVEINYETFGNALVQPVLHGFFYEGFTDPENMPPLPPGVTTDGIRNLVLRAKPTSKIWVGETPVLVRRTASLLDQSISKTLSIRKYFAETRDRKLPIEMLYDVDQDATHLYNLLKGFTTGETLREQTPFMAIAKDRTGDDWVAKEVPSDFNLYGSVVLYHGYNVGEYYTGYEQYSHVLALALSETCMNLKGVWLIHYNDPTVFSYDPCAPDRFPLHTKKA